MADKQDNRTEQWLQDYASHRREQHGSAPKMHDATRRLLHGEVQRTWGRPVSTESATGGWESWLLKFATGTVVLGALTLGVWVMIDVEQQVPERADDASGSNKMTKAALNQSPPKPKKYDQRNAAEDSLSTQPRNEVSAAAQSARAFSAHGDAPENHDVYRDMRHNFSQQQVQVRRGNSQAPSSQDIRPARAVTASSTQAGLEVMQNFEVIRDGSIIRIRDNDGSVYEGRVILASATPMMAAISGQTGQSSKGGGGIDGGSKKSGGGIDGGSNKGGGSGSTPPPPSEKKLPKIVSNTKSEVNKASMGGPPVPPGKGLRPRPTPVPVNPAQITVYNDNVETPLPITSLNKPLLGHNAHATGQDGREALYPNFHGRSVWFEFVAPADGNATISTRGSNFDTTLGVFTGNTAETIWMIGDQEGLPASDLNLKMDDNQPNVSWSMVHFECEANVPYRVAVDGVGGSTGQIRLTTRFRDATGKLLSTLPARRTTKTTNVAMRRAKGKETVFYFQVNGTNRTSGRPVSFEGFMHNSLDGAKNGSRKREGRASSVAEGTLRIKGRASYGGQWLTVDAFTASLTPAFAPKLKRQKK